MSEGTAMDHDPNDMHRLEAMIDKYGMAKVIAMLSEICGGKAEHVAVNWQDTRLAKDWSKAAEATGRNPGASTPILVNAIIFAALAEGVFILSAFAVK